MIELRWIPVKTGNIPKEAMPYGNGWRILQAREIENPGDPAHEQIMGNWRNIPFQEPDD